MKNTYIFDLVICPKRSRITVKGFNKSSPESIEEYKHKHNKSFLLTMTQHNHSNNSNKNKERINCHSNNHEEPI